MSRVSAALRREIRQRAEGRCEYCRHTDVLAAVRFEAEHIVPVKLRGEATIDNTAWACFQCNRFKGAAVAGYDHAGADVIRLFNPRRDEWSDHFSMEEGVIVPRTRIGGITAEVLRLNDSRRIDARRLLISRGLW
jgi:hypothetical protein